MTLTPSPFGATPSRREGENESFGSKKGHNKPLNTTESALVRMFQLTPGLVQSNNKRKKGKTMKVKIRGLVFAGFAAAVFAQSASAEITDSDKTVTSKTYVDSKIEGTVNNATTIDSESPDDKAPSSLNVYKFVSNQIVSSGGGVDGNPNYHTDKIGYLDSTWAQANNTGLTSPYMVTKADLAAHPTWQEHVVKWEIIVPDARVAKTATNIITGGTSNQTGVQENLTTAKAVYDFVTNGDPNDPNNNGFQPAVDSSATDSDSFRAGWYNNGAATWATVKVRGNGTEAQDPSLGYLVMDQQVTPNGDTGSVYTISLKNDSIAGLASDISAVGDNGGTAHLIADKLTTAKAVYDFVTEQVNEAAGDFQPKLTSAQASAIAGWGNNGTANNGTAIAVGYRGTGSTDDSGWKVFGARADGLGEEGDYHLSYLEVQPAQGTGQNAERDKYWVDIKSDAVVTSGSTLATSGAATGDGAYLSNGKLTTAKAVYEYAVKQQWETTDNGKHLVIGSDGKVTVSTNANPDIPVPTDSRCTQAGGTHVCALVAYYDADANGTGNGGIKYEWTVMAPTGN